MRQVSPARWALAGAMLLLFGTARAGDPPRPLPPSKLRGLAAFDWSTGKPCRAVDAALVSRWERGYVCMPPEDPMATSSGRALEARCTATRGHSEFLVFATSDDCKAERQTQAANE